MQMIQECIVVFYKSKGGRIADYNFLKGDLVLAVVLIVFLQNTKHFSWHLITVN